MNFFSYFFGSLTCVIVLIAYAIQTQEQFYPIILFLTTSKISYIVCGNMAASLILLVAKISKTIFLGNLRDAEVEMLLENIKYSVFETCLALTIFRNELNAQIILLFGMLLFIKSFHWLARSRFEYIEQVIPMDSYTYTRFSALLLVLIGCDIAATNSAILYTIKYGNSVLMLFGFEFGLLVISVLNLTARYIIFLIDNRLENGLASKGLCVMVIDLICSGCRFATYGYFFFLLFKQYGLPIHILREVWISFHIFYTQLVSLVKYIKLTSNLDQRFEDATPEEITSSGDCLICREPMEAGKKLPCSHVFHLNCLRLWLQHQQTCPLCRSDIPTEMQVHRSRVISPLVNPPNINDNNLERIPNAMHENLFANTNTDDLSSEPLLDIHEGLIASIPKDTSNLNDCSINYDRSNMDLKFPDFFVTIQSEEISVYKEHTTTSFVVRKIPKNTIVFVTNRQVISNINSELQTWYKIADGWIPECTFSGLTLKHLDISTIEQSSNSAQSAIIGIKSLCVPVGEILVESIVESNTSNFKKSTNSFATSSNLPFSGEISRDSSDEMYINEALLDKDVSLLLSMMQESINGLLASNREIERTLKLHNNILSQLQAKRETIIKASSNIDSFFNRISDDKIEENVKDQLKPNASLSTDITIDDKSIANSINISSSDAKTNSSSEDSKLFKNEETPKFQDNDEALSPIEKVRLLRAKRFEAAIESKELFSDVNEENNLS